MRGRKYLENLKEVSGKQYVPVAGICEHGIERSAFVKGGEFLD
jgi:hypothetical protein